MGFSENIVSLHRIIVNKHYRPNYVRGYYLFIVRHILNFFSALKALTVCLMAAEANPLPGSVLFF